MMKKKLLLLVTSFLLLLVCTYSSKVTVSASEVEGATQNLLINGDCSKGLEGWTITKGAWYISTEKLREGRPPITKSFRPKDGKKDSIMYQDVDIRNIPAGSTLKLSSVLRCYLQSPTADKLSLTLSCLDSNKQELARNNYTDNKRGEYWYDYSMELKIPENAVYARVTLEGWLNHGEVVDVHFANLSLTVNKNDYILDLEPRIQETTVSNTVTTSLFIDNIDEIAAEDVYIKYDTERLEFAGFEEVDGIKLVYSKENAGVIRVIVASKGEANIAHGKKTLLKLKFKAINKGEALVDVTKGRISDGIEMEENVPEEKCGYCIININPSLIPDDVNHSGEFTLLDLAIDGRHLGKEPASEELLEYNTDIVVNGAIDEDDLLQIGQYILENPNYPFN